LNVLIASAWDPTSGVLSVYRSLAKHLRPHGVTFSAFAFDGWRSDTWWTFCDELIDGRSITLAEVLMSGRYDLLHCVDTTYSPPYGVEIWVRRARFRGPVVLMAQVATRQLTGPVHATRYVACSEAAAEVLAHDADGPVSVIHNGYDADVFKVGEGRRRERPLLVWVGRSADPDKDVDLFLDAVEALPAYDAAVVDGTGEATAIRTRLDHLRPRVEHHPLLQATALAELFREAAASGGAFVSTSRSEGFGIAVVEAMACGCPAVIPRIEGHAQFVDGKHALVYERTRAVDGISGALARLQDRTVRDELIHTAWTEAAERWTSERLAAAYLTLYEDAMSSVAATAKPHFRDVVARAAWRAALAARPAWQKARALAPR
jgi:glycosyltransferase involved in cell wall biosynthesis